MQHRFSLLTYFVLLVAFGTVYAQPEVIVVSPSPDAIEAAKPAPVRSTTVDCSRGETIGKELSKLPKQSDVEFTIEIRGICEENVVLRGFTNLTLRGTDPAVDGIMSVGQEDFVYPYSTALTIDDSRSVRVENLSLAGLRPMRIHYSDDVRVMNSTLSVVGEGTRALITGHSEFLSFSDTTISSPVGFGVLAIASYLDFYNTTFSGRFGVYSVVGSTIRGDSSTIQTTSCAVVAANQSSVWLWQSEINNGVIGEAHSSITLNDVTQTAEGNCTHGLWDNTSLELGGVTEILGSLYVDNFSTASVFWQSALAGEIYCYAGGDVYCESPNIGSVFDCASCGAASSTAQSAPTSTDSDYRQDLSDLRRELRSLIERERLD